jgi:ethanolamine ammonia-lyase large subunit
MPLPRRDFLFQLGLVSSAAMLAPSKMFGVGPIPHFKRIVVDAPDVGEDLFTYIQRKRGNYDVTLYRQLVGAANEFKEGDEIAGIAADSDASRKAARELIANTRLADVYNHPLFQDEQYDLIQTTTAYDNEVMAWTFGQFKAFLIRSSEDEIKGIMPMLTSDIIAFVVKLMTNDELIIVSSKVFNPLPNSNIGSKGYMSARVQPNSPTDNIEDIIWQVFDAWSFGVGDLVLGTNPVSSDPQSVARIEAALYDLLTTFELEHTMPHCVLSHIDIQARVESMQPNTTGVWFQSLAGTVNANQTFDVTIEKMQAHADARTDNRFGLYAETGQGADGTNGHGEGFDMVVHESRKYGFLRALKIRMRQNQEMSPPDQINLPETEPWVFLNDVAGFIGPEVFRTKEQLVRCCLEDLVMGKLHGHTIGLDICTTLHMDVSLDDLDWCIDQIMPANPGYLMALPTKNDPMLSYLTTSFADHVRVREKFGYKVNDDMWAFFQRLGIISWEGEYPSPTELFGQPTHIYLQYCRAKGDTREADDIIAEGKAAIERVRKRGVPIAEGYGEQTWQLQPSLDKEIRELYSDAKYCLWTEWENIYLKTIPNAFIISSMSVDRVDYVYHPASGERISPTGISALQAIREKRKKNNPEVQIVISDGLNAQSLMDAGHLAAFLPALRKQLIDRNLSVAEENIVIRNGRVRSGYETGEKLFGSSQQSAHCIVHIIGERPGTMHRNFSVYITTASASVWNVKGKVDHDITRVVSGISDTAYVPEKAVVEVAGIIESMLKAG